MSSKKVFLSVIIPPSYWLLIPSNVLQCKVMETKSTVFPLSHLKVDDQLLLSFISLSYYIKWYLTHLLSGGGVLYVVVVVLVVLYVVLLVFPVFLASYLLLVFPVELWCSIYGIYSIYSIYMFLCGGSIVTKRLWY